MKVLYIGGTGEISYECVRAGLVAGLAVLASAGMRAAAEEITREEILAAFGQKITFGGPDWRKVGPEQKKAFAESLDWEKIGREVLPASLAVPDAPAKRVILQNAGVLLDEADPEYGRLMFKKAMMDTILRCKMSERLPKLSEAEKAAIADAVRKCLAGAEESMLKHLRGLIPTGQVKQTVKKTVELVVAKIDSPLTYVMKQELGAPEAERLLCVFEQRLALTVHRAAKRLEQASLEEREQPFRSRAGEAERILEEILTPLVEQIYNVTTAEAARAMNDEDEVPGYSEVVRKLVAMKREILLRRAAARRLRLRALRLKSALGASPEELLKESLKDLLRRPEGVSVDDQLAAEAEEHQQRAPERRQPTSAAMVRNGSGANPAAHGKVLFVIAGGALLALALVLLATKRMRRATLHATGCATRN